MSDPTRGGLTPPPIDPQLAALEAHDQQRQGLQTSLYVASQRPAPAQWAHVLRTARALNLPPDVVARNLPGLQPQADRQAVQPDLDRIVRDTPGLADWLQHPDHAALARHELQPLAQVDRGTRTIAPGAQPTADQPTGGLGTAFRTSWADLQASIGLLAAAYGHGTPRELAQSIAAANQRAAQLRAQAPGYVAAFEQAKAPTGAALDRDVAALHDPNGARRAGIMGVLNGMATVDQMTGAVRSLGDVLSEIALWATHPRATLYKAAEGAVPMAPMIAGAQVFGGAGAALGSVEPGLGTAAGGVAGTMLGTFVGTGAVNVGAEMNAELQKRGVDVTDPVALERALADPQVMATVRTKAKAAGLTNAAVVSLFSGIGGQALQGAKAAGAGIVGKTAAAAADIGVQSGGMAAAQVAGNAAKGERTKPSQILETALSTLAASAIMEGGAAARHAVFRGKSAAATPDAAAPEPLTIERTDAALAVPTHGEAEAPPAAVPEVGRRPERQGAALPEQGTRPERAGAAIPEPGRATGYLGALYGADTDLGGLPVVGRAMERDAFHADPVEAAVQVTQHAEDALRAHRDAQALAEIGAALTEAKTTASVPEAVKALVETAAGGDEAASVYFQPAEWNAYWQAQGLSPARAAEDVMQDGGQAYHDAVATGQPLAIPLGAYVAHVAPTEHWAGLIDHARTRPDGMSLAEAQQYLQTLPATLDQIQREAGQLPAEPASPEDAAKAVSADVAQQLEGAGYSKSAAKAQAQLYEAAFRTLARRTGQDPKALYDAYRLTIQRRQEPGIIDATSPEAIAAQDAREQALLQAVPAADAEAMLRQLAATGFAGGADATSVVVPHGQRIAGADDTVTMVRKAIGYAGREAFRTAADAEIQRRGAAGDVVAEQAAIEETARRLVQEGRALGALHQATPTLARGRITLGDAVQIELFPHADRSTFLHETGHFYLHVLDQLAGAADAPADLVADRATIRQWLGADADQPLTRQQHEQFARGFEAYLMEGKAPSPTLRSAFYRFKTWLTAVYRQLVHLDVNLTPEVRNVFDRLLATEDDLRAAEQDAHVAPLFPDPKAVGLSEDQAARYLTAVAEAHQAADEELTARAMREIRREESAEWKAWREPIEAEVTAQVDADPAYQARALLARGKQPNGEPLPEGVTPFKLSKAGIVDTYGADALDGLPKTMYRVEGGLHPDVAAELLGFPSGRDLLDAVKSAPPRDRAIAERTDAIMQERHGERLTDAEVRARAQAAVHGAKRSALLRRELQILASDHLGAFKGLVRAVSKAIPSDAAVQAEAQRIVGGTPLQALRPDLLLLATKRAASEAREALLKGDVAGAFAAKRRELLANEVYRAADAAAEARDAALQQFKKVFRRDETLAKTRDLDLVNAARAILASFGIGRSAKPATEYLEPLRQYDPDTYDTVKALVDQATTNAGNYKALTVDEFTAMAESVQSLWTLAKRSRQIEIDGVAMDRQLAVNDLVARLDALPTRATGPRTGTPTPRERAVAGLLSMGAALRRVEHWVRELDGGADDGPFRRYLWTPISEAGARFRAAKHDAIQQYRAIVDRLAPAMTHQDIVAPELGGFVFRGKRELLGALLHTGNASNLQKLLRGYGWGDVDPMGQLDRSAWDRFIARMQREGVLTTADYDYVQAVWDLLEQYKPGAQQAHRALYGRYFAEVTADPVTTPFGEYRGGYYPAKADPFITPDAGRKAEAESVLQADNATLFPAPPRGFTKSRVEAYAKPLILDAAAVPTHLDAVLKFTHLAPPVMDAARLVRDRGFAEALDAHDPHAISELLDPWLRRTAQQAIDTRATSKAGREVERYARMLRRNAGMQILSASLTTAAEQLTHVPAVALRVGPAALARGLWAFIRAPKEMVAAIHERSPYMATRESAGFMEARAAIDRILLDPNVAQRGSAWLAQHGMFLTRLIQHVEDHITWHAAYDEAVRGGQDETAAVRHADAAVRETLGAYEPESLSRFETGSPVVKLFSMFYSFFNTKANFLKTEVTTVLRADAAFPSKAVRLAGIYTLGFLVPALMAEGIKQQLNGERFDHDDDGPWNDVLALFFGSQLTQGARMVPIAGPAAQAVLAHFGHGQGPDLISSPAVALGEQALRAPGDVYHALHERLTHTHLTDLFTLLGMLTGTPARPFAKPLGYLHDRATGEAQSTGPFDTVRGLLTGQGSE